MSSNVIISYPEISQADFRWIQGIREEHDRQYKIVRPHVTFVFPTAKLSIEQLAQHAEEKVRGESKIAIELTEATVVEDGSKKYFHVFLVPSTGKEKIITLHNLLYTGDLASELRLDIPFIPHVGIAANESRTTAQALADTIINTEGIDIRGFLSALTIASFDGKSVHDIKQIQLA